MKTIRLALAVLFIATYAFADDALSLSSNNQGLQVSVADVGGFTIKPPIVIVPGGGREKPTVTVEGEAVTYSYPGGASLQLTCQGNTATYAMSGPIQAVQFTMSIPGDFTQGGKYAFGGKGLQDLPAIPGTEQFIAKGNIDGALTLVAPSGKGFTVSPETNWYGLQDNRAKGWGSNLDYSFLFDMRAHSSATNISISFEPYPAK